jgi:hypothetical protein
MPTSASLVTNLPADFNTFGQGVDTSLQDLLGGTTGQVLSKTSGTNMDFTWVTPTDQTPLTTKGDLFAFSTVDARLPAGANETRLVADSAQTLGLKYVADTTNYAIAAKGDLLAGTAADTLEALSVGTDAQILVADSTASTGLKWATPSGGGKVLQVVSAITTTATNISSTSYTDTTITATITPTSATSKILILMSVNLKLSKTATELKCGGAITRGATDIVEFYTYGLTGFGGVSSAAIFITSTNGITYLDSPATTSATTYKFRGATDASAVASFQNSGNPSTITLLEIGA